MRSRHASFYIDTITFLVWSISSPNLVVGINEKKYINNQVEDCLFKVPRKPFETDSVVFGDMFRPPRKGHPFSEEGKRDDNPIHLTATKKDEFEQLLSVLFYRQVYQIARRSLDSIAIADSPSSFRFCFSISTDIDDRTNATCQHSLPETTDQWTSVLKLAIEWEFETIFQTALDRLKELSAVDRIALGERFYLDFESWLLPAMHEIVRRPEPISIEEGRRMGLETSLKLACVREHVPTQSRGHLALMKRPDVQCHDLSQVLRSTFVVPPPNISKFVGPNAKGRSG